MFKTGTTLVLHYIKILSTRVKYRGRRQLYIHDQLRFKSLLKETFIFSI